jgi:hypothetical protein
MALVGAIFYPVSYLAAPAWEVWIADESGAPVQGMTVRLSYQHYSVESSGHEQDAISDSHGHVQFPSRISSAPLARYIVYSISSATAGAHASFGRHAHVFAFGRGLEGSATTDGVITNWTGTPDRMESRIVAVRLK